MYKLAVFFLLFSSNIFAQKQIDVYFDSNKSNINVENKIKLDSLIKDNDSISIFKIEGFCDKKGSQKYNYLLSLKRAKTVFRYFKNQNKTFAKGFKIAAFGKKFKQHINQNKNRKVKIYFAAYDKVEFKNKKEIINFSEKDIKQSKSKDSSVSAYENNIEQSKNKDSNISIAETDKKKSKSKKPYISVTEKNIEAAKNKESNIAISEKDVEQSSSKKSAISISENNVEKSKNRKQKVPTSENDLKNTIDNAKKGDFIKLKNINFVNNSDEILPKSFRTLMELLKVLQENEFLSIEIQGHICCKTPEEIDLISEARAKAIYKFLVKNKIDKSRLSYKGFGVSRPIFEIPERNELEQEQNRRVEILILDN